MEKRRLLLVDDEAGIRLTLGTILQMRGFEVKTAATVGEALTAMQEEQYDVLVSDLNIGQPYDGFTIASAMRRIQPKVATVMITGYPAFEDALESIRQQVDDYLIKPTDVDDLVNCIEAKLQIRKPYSTGQQKRAIVVVHENRDYIIKKWLSSVNADHELASISLTPQQRKGHLPQFLDALTAQVEAPELAVSKVAAKAAALHGEHRSRLGYSIPLVAREARMLGTVIFEVLQEYLLEIKISRLVSDMAEISTSIHQQLEHSLRAFVAAGQPSEAC
jgi:YesN/AraC family two-component response regulator